VPEPTLAILDVGHGNCAILSDDKVAVIDAGPGTALLEFLAREGIKRVHVVLISHADEDHIKGLVSLIESQNVTLDLIRINSDSLKGSPTWNDLIFVLDEANKTGKLRFEVGLTTNDSDRFNTASIRIEILAPSPGLAVKGPGSEDHRGRKLTSNSNSVVVRLVRDGTSHVILPGDIDETGLQNLLESGQDLRASVAVFPHHGGGAASSDLPRFAAEFSRATGAESLIFSIGRGRYDTPKPEVVDAARRQLPKVRILCTQLSEHCASQLPKLDPTHLTGKFSRGLETRRCCSGTIVLTLAPTRDNVLPLVDKHLRFISESAPSALCTKPLAGQK